MRPGGRPGFAELVVLVLVLAALALWLVFPTLAVWILTGR